ncbi:hypothetical protein SxD43FB_18570 [Sphingobium sp. D43FB]|nr:hypothetical protein SxD43FB_18570 [Sphingobium sp. D43FB]
MISLKPLMTCLKRSRAAGRIGGCTTDSDFNSEVRYPYGTGLYGFAISSIPRLGLHDQGARFASLSPAMDARLLLINPIGAIDIDARLRLPRCVGNAALISAAL